LDSSPLASILECGGKSSVTPLSSADKFPRHLASKVHHRGILHSHTNETGAYSKPRVPISTSPRSGIVVASMPGIWQAGEAIRVRDKAIRPTCEEHIYDVLNMSLVGAVDARLALRTKFCGVVYLRILPKNRRA
jgi:hypothetical protein